ncbi:M4 family metallopeptidase [Streptomyces sp. SID13031]|uniref:M4 family metallopeptidase n=1 Tax=Streptomyces sp. SID13031 TaxID=2706046 RepID=UPI0031BA6412
MTVHHIVPPYLLEHLERTADDPNLRARYRQSLQHDAVLRSRPAAFGQGSAQLEGSEAGARRVVHDAENGTCLPGTPARREGDPAVADETVNRAYDGTGATWTMFKECFGRDSVDGAGLPLNSTVHFDRGYANAFWDGAQMVFGDGDGEIFGDFTRSIDVTGHELTHGVTQYTAGLVYEGQSGALNESLSDVFGSLAKQHHLGQSAAEADWLIGAELFRPGVAGVALRSMKAPGTAYDDPRLGRDPQPAHMSGFVETTDDNGGVHLNSGIPNHAFYLLATTLGGNAYEKPGQIWYTTLTSGTLTPTTTFTTFAEATHRTASTMYGPTSPETTAVTQAWQSVGVLLPTTAEVSSTDASPADAGTTDTARTTDAETTGTETTGTESAGTETAATETVGTETASTADTGDATDSSSERSEAEAPPGQSAESVELMRAANTSLALNTPPAPPATPPAAAPSEAPATPPTSATPPTPADSSPTPPSAPSPTD